MDDELKNLITKHYAENFANKQFIPGQTLIPASGKSFGAEEMIAMTNAVLQGWWTEGDFAAEFEKKFASYIGLKHCVTTNSGSSANLLAVSALTSFRLAEKKLNPGDEVITIAANFPTTINPIIINKLIPVFIDVDIATLNPDIKQIKAAISPKTRAVFLPGNMGNVTDLAALREICNKQNIYLIEDICDTLGTEIDGKKAGSFGDLSTFSFYAGHHMTMGEGGAVCTSDDLLARAVRSMRDWGRDCQCKTGHDNTCCQRFKWQLGDLPYGYDHKFIFSDFGYNLRLTDIQAALGLVQLEKLDKFTEIRRENFKYLYTNLKQYEKYFILPGRTKNSNPSWFGFWLTIRPDAPFSRNEIIEFLENKKITTRLIICGNVIKQPYFKNYNFNYRLVGNLKNTDIIMNNSFFVGLYQALGKPQLDFIIKSFNEFFKKYEK